MRFEMHCVKQQILTTQTHNSMITNNFYQTPVLEYLDAESEGVLCQSGYSFNPYDEIEL